MKKTYITPATIVATEIKNNILAGSIYLNEETTTDQYTPENYWDDMWE